jgi:hypothetical protein
MPFNLERLVPGDITTDGGHTMIYVDRVPDDGNRWGGYGFVDVYPMGGLKLRSSQTWSLWFDNDVYRCADPHVARVATEYAKFWADCGGTSYSPERSEESPRYVQGAKADKRSFGVEEELRRFQEEEEQAQGSGRAPPFEFDALYRALSWAGRTDRGFSANRGSTCCAFAIACYHAASIFDCAGGDQGKIAAALEELRNMRLQKRPVTADDLVTTKSGKKLSPAAFRRFSNAGANLGEGVSFEEFANRTLSKLAGTPTTLEQVFTEPLLVDAKFTHTKLLIAQFRSHGKGWEKQNFALGNPMER